MKLFTHLAKLLKDAFTVTEPEHELELSPEELRSMLTEGIAACKNDDQIDNCLSFMNHYRNRGGDYDKVIRALDRDILFQKVKVSFGFTAILSHTN